MFNSINILRQRLASDNSIEVCHKDYLWHASFQWNVPCTEDESRIIQNKLNPPLPEDYLEFLYTISNGAILFYDATDSQWGYKIYGTKELLEKQKYWAKNYASTLPKEVVVIGETFGDSRILVTDTMRRSKDRKSCSILEGNVYDSPSVWPVLSRSFHEWLDHLITAQGDKYWEWL